MNNELIIEFIVSMTAIAVAYISIVPQLQAKKRKKELASLPKISDHPFFSRSEMIKHHIDMTFTLENKGKERVFKDIMMNQIVIFQESLTLICQQVDDGTIETSQELLNLHIQTIDKIMFRHYHYYKTDDGYSQEDKEVLDIVMKKYAIWNKGRIEHLQSSIELVCGSPYYTDTNTRAAVIMDLYLGVMVDTLNNGSLTLGGINGDLSGLVFKNVKI